LKQPPTTHFPPSFPLTHRFSLLLLPPPPIGPTYIPRQDRESHESRKKRKKEKKKRLQLTNPSIPSTVASPFSFSPKITLRDPSVDTHTSLESTSFGIHCEHEVGAYILYVRTALQQAWGIVWSTSIRVHMHRPRVRKRECCMRLCDLLAHRQSLYSNSSH
jgi:hypothetical protein